MVKDRVEAQIWPRPFPGVDSWLVVGSGRLARADYDDRFGYRSMFADPTLLQVDVKSTDPSYWHRLRAFLQWLAAGLPQGSRDWWARAYKSLRRQHHDSKRKGWDDVLPREIVKWAWDKVSLAQEGEPCCDNVRVALKGNTGQVRRYRRQRESGCCGFSDFEAVGPDGKVYMLGFNYGH